MAQTTLPRSSTAGSNLEAQTRYLFHRYVHQVTSDSDSTLDAGSSGAELGYKAFEEMNHMDPRVIFGPVESLDLDNLVSCLRKHAVNMQNDTRLQQELGRLKERFNKETLWKLCQKVFSKVDNVWTGILAVFAFGMEYCRQLAVSLYDIIADTITAAVMYWAGDWLASKGGWLAVVAAVAGNSGMVQRFRQALSSWADWLRPSSSPAPQQAAVQSASGDGALTSGDGASTSGDGASASGNGASP